MTAKDISLFVYWPNPKFMFSSSPADHLIPTSLSLSLFVDNSNCNIEDSNMGADENFIVPIYITNSWWRQGYLNFFAMLKRKPI